MVQISLPYAWNRARTPLAPRPRFRIPRDTWASLLLKGSALLGPHERTAALTLDPEGWRVRGRLLYSWHQKRTRSSVQLEDYLDLQA